MVLPPVPQAVSRLKKKKPKVDYIKSIQKLDIREGDIIVLKTNDRLTQKIHDRIKSQWEDMKGSLNLDNINMIILEEGMDIGVLRKELPVLKLKDGEKFTPLGRIYSPIEDTLDDNNPPGSVPNKPISPPPCPELPKEPVPPPTRDIIDFDCGDYKWHPFRAIKNALKKGKINASSR